MCIYIPVTHGNKGSDLTAYFNDCVMSKQHRGAHKNMTNQNTKTDNEHSNTSYKQNFLGLP